ncbi:AAA family ATPase [Streptomyces tuirus]|uniref:AAA family ATPase n=1 Tax=Streptomyces tuirus TaxID=68278 RepID=A0A941FHK1_9ACTN|nr:AAA family ATPase [Streptomyces tuirus]
MVSDSRLVTLTGVGGVGKTRLALRVAQQAQRAFRHGTWLVELAPLRTPEPLPLSVCDALGVDPFQSPPLDVLVDHLRDRQLLLVLDNCEQLQDACSALVESLLRACPDVRVLATTRHRLGVPGEHTFQVPPLAHPDPDQPVSPRALPSYESVVLFADRAAAVLNDFVITADNAAEVAALCSRLDGIPLALELAAVRLRSLSLTELVERLDDRFQLLTSGSRTALPRQQTLRALIDWSFDLCTDAERALWARLSVFAGEFDVDAAQEVCADDHVVPQERILDLLACLVDKSVLTCDHRGPRARYRMLETIRQYGEERLAADGDAVSLRLRHRDHYLRLAKESGRHWFTPTAGEWLARLHTDDGNLHAALQFCLSQPGEAATGLVLAAELGTYWEGSGSVVAGRNWLDRLLARSPERGEARARGLAAAGWLAVLQGDPEAATALLDECEAMVPDLGDLEIPAQVALFRGMAAMCSGDLPLAMGLLKEALARHRELGNPYLESMALFRLALAASAMGDSKRAVAWSEECRSLCEAHGESWSRAYALWVLAVERMRCGEDAAATELAEQSLRDVHHLGDRLGVALGLELLAWIAVTDGRAERAAVLFGQADAMWQASSAPLAGFGLLRGFHDGGAATARKVLGTSAFRRAFEEGARLATAEAVSFALGSAARSGPGGAQADRGSDTKNPLTRRETEVAAMVVHGLTNREIAAALVIGQRTVESHIEHIMAKLSFTSRAQIAAWATDRGLDRDVSRAAHAAR